MRKQMRNIGVVIGITMILTICLGGCAGPDKATSGQTVSPDTTAADDMSETMKKIKENGKIVMGTSADYPPFEFHKSIDGKDTVVGFDIDIAREVAKDLGVDLEVKDISFDGLLAAMNAGNVDMVIAGMEASEERKQSVDFSKMYYQARQAVLIRKTDQDSIKTIEDIKSKVIGYQKASKQETIVNEQFADSIVKGLGKLPDIVMALKNNKVDVFLTDLPVAESYAKANPDLFLTDIVIPVVDQGAAIAMRKNSTDVIEVINKTIDRMTAEGLIDKYFVDNTALMEAE